MSKQFFEVDNGFKGECRLEVLEDGKVISDTGWTTNHITNHGLFVLLGLGGYVDSGNNISGSRSNVNYHFTAMCHVGSGTTPPKNTDEVLETPVSSVAASPTPVFEYSAPNSVRTNYHRLSQTTIYVFDGIDATITEVGLSTLNNTPLNTRLLVPSTKVTSNQVLRVTYRIKHFIEIVSKVGFVNQHDSLSMSGGKKRLKYKLVQGLSKVQNLDSHLQGGSSTVIEDHHVLGGGAKNLFSTDFLHLGGGIYFYYKGKVVAGRADSQHIVTNLPSGGGSLVYLLTKVNRQRPNEIAYLTVTDTHCSYIDGIFVPFITTLPPFDEIRIDRNGTFISVKFFNESDDPETAEPIVFTKTNEVEYFFGIKINGWRYTGADEE